jgi:hypothetical protein
MAVYNKRGRKGTHWIYDLRVRGVRYRGSIPEHAQSGKPNKRRRSSSRSLKVVLVWFNPAR